jgi:tryptophan synthase alpha chain
MIKAKFKNNHPLFIPFIVAGFPNLAQSIEALLALSAAGADIIELGVPFSDPIADGPIIQDAVHQAIEQGTNLNKVLDMIHAVRLKGCETPIIIFSYLNPVLSFGIDAFTLKAKAVGANGVLIVDLPPEEGLDIYMQFKQAGLEIILLVSPTTCPERYKLYKKLDPAFIYYISRLAVTGMQTELSHKLRLEFQHLKNHFVTTPVAVGFGISTIHQAKEIAQYADGVIIGSLLVKILKEEDLCNFQSLASIFRNNIIKTF